MRRPHRLLFLSALLASLFAQSAQAAVEFGPAGAQHFGPAQRDFLDRLLSAKAPFGADPVKSLVGSHDALSATAERPSLDLSALSRDLRLGSEAWMRYAESLYAGGQYAAAAQALDRVDEVYRADKPEAVTQLQLKLALRGAAKLPPQAPAPAAPPGQAGVASPAALPAEVQFNQILALVRAGDSAAAFARLRELSAPPEAELRDRALLWGALLALKLGDPREATAVLSRLDGASPLAADGLLAYLRIKGDEAHPALIAAVERQLSAAGASPLAWETRDRLLRSLLARGAVGEATERAVDAAVSIGGALDAMRRARRGVGTLPAGELAAHAASIADPRRFRVDALAKQRERLTHLSRQLVAWRPYLKAYRERLQRDRLRFADEIRQALAASRDSRAKDDSGLNALFHLELSRLVGKPADADAAYRIFFGLSQWELSFEFPETWRPVIDTAKEQRGERRRQREVVKKRERDDQRYLPRALDNTKKLAEKVDRQLEKVPKLTYEGMVEEGAALAESNLRLQGEIDRLLPTLDDAMRRELAEDVVDRERIAEQWLIRFAALALAGSTQAAGVGEQPVFELDRPLALRRGEALVKSLEALPMSVRQGKPAEVSLAAVRDALQPLTVAGASREIRADALRLRAQMTVALYEAQAIPSASDAVEHYSELLRDYSDLVDRADVTYQLARAQDLAQQMEPSLATLEGFVKKYPKDARAGEAAFRIAEAQFSLSDYPRARVTYEAVIRQGDKRFLDQAEYKLAWTLFKLGDYRAALPKFVAVIDRGYGSQAGSDQTRRNRMQDAFRALSLTFSNLDGAADVERFFAGKGKRPYIGDIYYSLARYYVEHKRVNDGATAYAYLHKHYPNHDRAPELLAAVVLAARQERLSKLSLDTQEQYANRYAISGAYWAQASAEVRTQIATHMEPFLAQLAQIYHADAQQQKKADSFGKAIRYYEQFVSSFPKAAQAPQFHFLLAEARFETGDVRGALQDYERAAYDYGDHPKAAEAGYALLVATQKVVGETPDRGERKAGLRLLVARSARFASTFPADTRVEAVLVKAGEDILMLGDAAEAVRLGERLLARTTTDQVSRRALLISAHGYFESGAFDKAEGAYVALLAQGGREPKEQAELRERLGLAVYRQAEALRDAGQNTAAIEGFLRVARIAPATEAIPSAEIDAAALLLAGKRWREAIDVLERFEKTYPGHRLGVDIPVRLAFAYENDGRFVLAADLLEKLSRGEKDDAMARQMHWRSAELREKAGRMDLAVATYERYLLRYPQPLDKATEVRQSLAELAGKANELATRDRWLNEIITHARAAAGQESVRVRFLAAQASVTLGDGRAAEFDAVRLKLPLDKSLAEKRRAMEAALRWYEEAGRYGVAEVTTAATYKTAEVYRRLARDVMASERPAGLSALELGQYNILLEEEAGPFDEKATELHELNYRRLGGGLYDDWVKKSLLSLRVLQPAQYDKVEVAVGPFEYTPPKPPAAPGAGTAAASANPKTVVDAAAQKGAADAPAR